VEAAKLPRPLSLEPIFGDRLPPAIEKGMTTMRQYGIRLCLEGLSSVPEIRRVTGDRLS
jgi:type II secretory ATPase GspE/PulE/Tfp pilus assembly ATPase PilB-like protein